MSVMVQYTSLGFPTNLDPEDMAEERRISQKEDQKGSAEMDLNSVQVRTLAA